MNSYRFSPIKRKEYFIEAVKYVAEQTSNLANKIVGAMFQIESLTIFSHSDEEFENLKKIQAEMGDFYNYSNGPRVVLHEPIIVGQNQIRYVRIRKPDLDRPQVGCNDFETDYVLFKKQYLAAHPNDLKLVKRPEYEMIEFSHPDFDVLAYVVSKNI